MVITHIESGIYGLPRGPEDMLCSDLPTQPDIEHGTVLVTGAGGYIGGRLVPELLARGYRVRVMVRGKSPEQKVLWPGAEISVADAIHRRSLNKALAGVDTAYYLIHSLHLGPKKFAAADIEAARNFRKAAERAGVRRIIYLGGLGDDHGTLSSHLRSRMEVAQELARGDVPVTILRAAVIIGSGSASYEIIKNLVDRVPVMIMPGWTHNRCQPIGVRDVIRYLVGVLEVAETAGKSFDIGGADELSYRQMMRVMAELHKKRVLFVPFPFPIIGLFAYVASLFTPVPDAITRCLFDSLQSDVVCRNDSIRAYLPLQTMEFREAVVRAMSREEQDRVYTRWSDAYPPAHELAMKMGELESEPRYTTSYSLTTHKAPMRLFRSICRVGGKKGWFHTNWMWRLRGLIDRVLLGVGTARGRRSSKTLRVNDVIDFWRVEDLVPDRRLLLRAEMKLPGRAWLEFRIGPPEEPRGHQLAVHAFFDTAGIWGRTYWYIFKPFHRLIFQDLIQQIERRS